MGFIETQIAINADLDTYEVSKQMESERAVEEVIVNGCADTPYGELVLVEDVIPTMLENDEAIGFVLEKLITGDLTAIKELRMLAVSAGNEKIEQWANAH